jgi:hypothetical protein
VAVVDVERHRRLAGRVATDARHPELYDEAASWGQVSRRVGEALHLLILRTQVADAVPHDVHEREAPGRDSGGHVSDHDGQLLRGCLVAQLVDHRLRQLDPRDRDSATGQRDRDSSGADGQFESRAGTGQPGQERDRGVEHVWREHVRRSLVIPRRSLCIPHVTARHGRHCRLRSGAVANDFRPQQLIPGGTGRLNLLRR